MWEHTVDDPGGASLDAENDDSDSMFDFMVEKTNEQEENVTARQGFMV